MFALVYLLLFHVKHVLFYDVSRPDVLVIHPSSDCVFRCILLPWSLAFRQALVHNMIYASPNADQLI